MSGLELFLSTSPLGATVTTGQVSFRVWAPQRKSVEVVFLDEDRRPVFLSSVGDGFFQGVIDEVLTGHLYQYRLDGAETHPDPYSRFQPQGPHGPSMIVDPHAHQWRDEAWRGLDPDRQIIYEMHIGTFTEKGTYAAAIPHLRRLQQLGITCLEIMPVNEFVGRFGWGYDGVNWFAPYHLYGECEALKLFVDHAHELGLGVILDVVYNHFGHDGNYLPRFSAEYFTDKVKNPWGSSPNYACLAMRRLAIDNAVYWVQEYHFDGLRLDAIQNIHDPEAPSLLASLVREARAAAGDRRILVSAEDYLQRSPLLKSVDAGGADVDLLWNDDFHHTCRVAMTGNHYGFFKNYRGEARELLSSLKRGFLFQGQYDAWGNMNRGFFVADEPLSSFVAFTQNHDAIANTLDGQRLPFIVSPSVYRAITAILLLGPQTPLIFMGQEFGATTPFAYFADYPGESDTLWKGRKEEAQLFLQYRDPDALARIPSPTSLDTVKVSTLRDEERQADCAIIRLFSDLIKLRRRFETRLTTKDVDGSTLTENAFVFRWFDLHGADRLLLVNLGSQLELRAWAEPLLAPPINRHWSRLWSSEAAQYGGMGAIEPLSDMGWQLSSNSATLMLAVV